MAEPAAAEAPSIASRVGRALLGWALLWGGALALAVSMAVRHEMGELQDDGLLATAEALLGSLDRDDAAGIAQAGAPLAAASGANWGAPAAAQPGPVDRPQQAHERVVWQVVGAASPATAAGPLLRASSGAPLAPLLSQPVPGYATAAGWRVYTTALPGGQAWLLVAQSREERIEAQREVATSTLAVTGVMAAAGLWWLRRRMRRELAPLQALSDRLASHDPLAPGATLGPAERSELQPMHAAIDSLGQRLAARLAHERAFSAHAAHALRTPLAGIDAQLAVALREAPADLQPRLQRVRTAAGRLQRVVAALLSLFRRALDVGREPLDLVALVQRIPVPGLDVQVQASHSLRGDGDLLTAALLNLLDNALRHGAQRVWVTTPRAQCLRVHDDGPGVDATRRGLLLQALQSDPPGPPAGLGLQLAQLVARAHGGSLLLPALELGFAVELDLGPLAAAAGAVPARRPAAPTVPSALAAGPSPAAAHQPPAPP